MQIERKVEQYTNFLLSIVISCSNFVQILISFIFYKKSTFDYLTYTLLANLSPLGYF